MSFVAFAAQQRLSNNAPFPALLNFGGEDDAAVVDSEKQQLLLQNIEKGLAESGAVLVRGLSSLRTATDFDRFVVKLGRAEFPYAVGAEATRSRVTGRVLTANDGIPLDLPIGFHNEMAYHKDSPSRIAFFCEKAPPPDSGGCTFIVHGRTVYERMVQVGQQDFLDELENKGVCYFKWLSSGHGPGSWKSMFKTEDQQEASERGHNLGAKLSWHPDGSGVFQSAPCPAIKLDQLTGQKLWFNTIHGIQVFKRTRPEGAFDVVFGDGTPLPQSSVDACSKVLEEVKVVLAWQQEDVLIIDNHTVLHAREPCSQTRTILVSFMR